MRKITFIIIYLFSLNLNAANQSKITVVAQRSGVSGLEQTAMVFDGKKVELVLNSNFFEVQAKNVRIGHFESDVSQKLKIEFNQLKQISKRITSTKLPTLNKTNESQSPHTVKVLINGVQLSQKSMYYKEVIRLLQEPWNLSEWKPVDAVAAKIKGKQEFEVSYLGKSSSQKGYLQKMNSCQSESRSRWRCKVQSFGLVYLAKNTE